MVEAVIGEGLPPVDIIGLDVDEEVDGAEREEGDWVSSEVVVVVVEPFVDVFDDELLSSNDDGTALFVAADR